MTVAAGAGVEQEDALCAVDVDVDEDKARLEHRPDRRRLGGRGLRFAQKARHEGDDQGCGRFQAAALISENIAPCGSVP
jgi:hypothetical protein